MVLVAYLLRCVIYGGLYALHRGVHVFIQSYKANKCCPLIAITTEQCISIICIAASARKRIYYQELVLAADCSCTNIILFKEPLEIFIEWYITGPEQWTQSLVISLPKNCNLNVCKKYRTICKMTFSVRLNGFKGKAEQTIGREQSQDDNLWRKARLTALSGIYPYCPYPVSRIRQRPFTLIHPFLMETKPVGPLKTASKETLLGGLNDNTFKTDSSRVI